MMMAMAGHGELRQSTTRQGAAGGVYVLRRELGMWSGEGLQGNSGIWIWIWQRGG